MDTRALAEEWVAQFEEFVNWKIESYKADSPHEADQVTESLDRSREFLTRFTHLVLGEIPTIRHFPNMDNYLLGEPSPSGERGTESPRDSTNKE
jgi:hypothetical protein